MENLRNKPVEYVKNLLYADSPFDLASVEDDAYRDGVDLAIEYFEKWLFDNEI